MGKQQEDAYQEAIEEYRSVLRSRIEKSDQNLNNVSGLLPKRQISNYFVQFRKVFYLFYPAFYVNMHNLNIRC